MDLMLDRVEFDGDSAGARFTRTEDGGVLAILFDRLVVQSDAADVDAAPQTARLEAQVVGKGSGWVSVMVRGMVISSDPHGYAHVAGWANGRRMRAASPAVDEPFAAAVAAPVGADGRLRLSLLLLAQRDLGVANSAAQCAVDSIDIEVIDSPTKEVA